MKKIIPLLLILSVSNFSNAQDSFKNLWLQVESLEIENLPKSALEIVDKIYTKAEKENNSAQIIKSLFYQSKFSLTLEENAKLKIIHNFKKHIEKSNFPTRNVLENILGNLYWQYFNINKYTFYNRTRTANKVDIDDFRTWDLETLFEEIHCHFEASLENSLKLQETNITDFAPILEIEKNASIYKPTLYDFLANNALEFYKTSETTITNPVYKFEIDNPDFLSDYKTFTKLKLTTKDTASLQFNALKIYQNLIYFHAKKNNLKALVDIDIQRLNFVNNHATFNDKETVFLSTLKSSRNQISGKEESALYAFEIAEKHQTNSENKIAFSICEDVINRFPESLGAKKCSILKNHILEKSLSITSEEFVPTNTVSRALITYKNIDKLYFTAYKVSEDLLNKFNKTYDVEEIIQFINSLEKSKDWSANLRDEKDYLQHTTEIFIPKFDNGRYLIIASKDQKINKESTFGTATIQATNLALIENSFNNKHNYQVVDRNTGKPIENALIHITNPNRRHSGFINKKLKTDINGFASFKSKNTYYNSEITVKSNNDFAYFGNHSLYKDYKRNVGKTQTSISVYTFTDRSIYRPAQTVYFKSIIIKKYGDTSSIYTDELITVNLKDVNNQTVKTLELKSNEFGSIAGEFILPNNGLTGQYFIEVKLNAKNKYSLFGNRSYFSVEEYKRPKFETEFKPITEIYKINDSVTITGFANSFSGANITDAKVVYRVHRIVQYPTWYSWRRPNINSSAQEITHGESVTNNKGEFKITFKALADKSVSKENLPIFNYEITADVTDLNGETRSATSVVKVGYHALNATVSIDNKIDKNNKEIIVNIDTKNLNNEFVPAKGIIKIYKLQAPKNVLRKRPWELPDYQDISENTFRTLFPHDAYSENEINENNWQKGELVFSKNFDSEKSKKIALKNTKSWISGKYIVVLESKDKFDQKVKDEKIFSLFSTKDKKVADNNIFTINTNKTSYFVDDTVELKIGSASKNSTITVQIEKKHVIVATHLVQLNDNIKTIKIPVNKEDLRGFAIKYHFVNYNSFKSGSLFIDVIKPLENIEFETNIFRDKLNPGAKETWSFTIKNDKKDTIAAEVLASMYDASLDAFRSHNWSNQPKPQSYKTKYNSYQHSSANNSFKNAYYYIKNNKRYRANYPSISNNKYNWFGFSLNNNRWKNQDYLRGLRSKINNNRTVFDGIITGFIGDEDGQPLPGVSILVKGTLFGTQTDFDGYYSIKIKKGDILTYSYLGFKSEEKSIKNQTTINLNLKADAAQLDEVVVVGYGTQKRKKSTKALTALQGRVAGVQIIDAEEEVEETVIESTETDETEMVLEDVPFMKIDEKGKISLDGIKARTNFNETAFFFPQLKTDKNGKVSFSFTMPEALTKWKLQLLAHTKNVKSATKTLETVTQKELMVVPNAPRFLREGDKITLSAKISNLTNKKLDGLAQLILTDAITGKEINTVLENTNTSRNFSVDKNGNTNVSWQLSIPETVQAVQYKIVAKAGDFSDGEQNVLPVLSNRMLVTETLPMWIRSNQTKTFTLDKLKNQSSSTLKNHKLTLEITSNPVWYAIQALPYLMEYPYECAEQTFSRYYANTIASFVANSNPRIQEVFNAWKSSDALLSNLEKNQELKSLIIQETPWLRDAQSETEQKKRIALLFDLNKMKNEQEKAINKLQDIQMNSGGFPWFKGGRYESNFITQHIATGFGHLEKLGITNFDASTKNMIEKSVKFLDKEILENYTNLIEQANNIKKKATSKQTAEEEYNKYLSKNHLNYFTIQYLYMRSFYSDISLTKKGQEALNYYQNQSIKYWNDYNLYAKGQIALSLFRNDKKLVANKILKSLKENAITSDELGMYWKSNKSGYFYYQSPIETQALLIETFSEIENDTKTIDNLKIWLLKNKQTNRWKTTKATTEAVYALLLNGSDWVGVNTENNGSITEMVDIKIGDKEINPTELEDVKVEAGTGYFKTSWNGSDIKKEMAKVTINKKENGIAWGGLYWQYFEDLDKVTSAETPLKINKKLFLKVNSDSGKELQEITENITLKVGDLITVRIELRSDRDMEFIHMKDMRASGVEPISVLSKYKWQDNLGYYESTKDAATNFFFDRLPKGVYVFEYDVRVNNAGNFSNGITTIQSMYAPEFSSHSKGTRLIVY
ncbi:alpha-2-macroglobulin family protein [Polaribacter sargassicola]|uniref:alpha-2-macroglobulin family protein n=1 Tax=Polaribacter sargassicola TaxID=2836891 RepID=UPI001F19D546|nr:carboxypeptidase-like regulatory domain-containing protein [Polaribacter sp. DS7-9]MCG1035729.1 carboxypeptidase-like regulatory domain-containing protein [Polaribacter sp. DS7-9]